jgi:hypothetical protein
MWPFSSPRNPYRETIEAKRARRAEAIKLAPPFKPEEHQKYLNATGNWCFISRSCSRLLSASRGVESVSFVLDSVRDCGEYPGSLMDCFGRTRGLHRARGTSAAGVELLHGGYVRTRVAGCHYCATSFVVVVVRWALTFGNEFRSVLRRSHGRSA